MSSQGPPGEPPDYLNGSIGEFLELMASDRPGPSGGAAAAIAVALGAALAGMVARVSAAHGLSSGSDLAGRADELRARVGPLAEEDVRVYRRVLAASSAAEENAPGLAEALSEASDVPLEIAEIGAATAELAGGLAAEGKPNLRGDASAALWLAEAGTRAAAELVAINLRGHPSDERPGRAAEALRRARAAVRRATG